MLNYHRALEYGNDCVKQLLANNYHLRWSFLHFSKVVGKGGLLRSVEAVGIDQSLLMGDEIRIIIRNNRWRISYGN